ncbi:MAG TPA: hypothetical protein PK200_01535 [Spirochaetota bacterium]|nr:hypothetical protein [Spirochaetota bacterium]HQO02970.1 hypothetical protein [Spirochaetota bacterium]HQP50069.1 hypothetical protein [Spirochaetota bacterium]
MPALIRILRVVFNTSLGLLNFIYTTVSVFVVFSAVFEKTGIFKNRHAIPDTGSLFETGNQNFVLASLDNTFLIPLYVLLGLIGLMSVFMFLYFLVTIPRMTALFYINRLDRFLFIDGKKTIKFFIMLLLPLLNTIYVEIMNPGAARIDLMESMILCVISHAGILILLFFIEAIKEKAAAHDDKLRFIKIAGANIVRASMLFLTLIFFVLPYLLYYHFVTDIPRVAGFHFFLISGIIANYRFYSENFMEILIEASDEEK